MSKKIKQMQNFPCVYLIFTCILGVWMHPKKEKHYGEFVVICLISRKATNDSATLTYQKIQTNAQNRTQRRDGACTV